MSQILGAPQKCVANHDLTPKAAPKHQDRSTRLPFLSTTMATLRWGFLGCGKISNDFVNALKNVPGAHFRACAARSLSSAQEFATTHGACV